MASTLLQLPRVSPLKGRLTIKCQDGRTVEGCLWGTVFGGQSTHGAAKAAGAFDLAPACHRESSGYGEVDPVSPDLRRPVRGRSLWLVAG